MPRKLHNSAVELSISLFRRKRKRGNTGSRSAVGLKSFSIVGRRYSAGSSRRFSLFFSDRFERRGLVYVGSSIQHKTASDAVFAEYGFTWDAGNRITEYETVDGTAEYTYDKTGQLTGADYDYITDELYTYDSNGNRTNAGYVTGENNETLSDGTYRYSYDAEGNRTEKFLWTDSNNDGVIDASEKALVQTYNWDYRNRLESVTNYENGIAKEIINYLYDYLNLMIERTITDAATSALQSSDFNIYSNGQVVLEYDTTSSIDVVKSVNLWGANIDELAAVEQIAQSVNDSNVILWTYSDHLNSIRDVVLYDSIIQTAAVVNHLIYNAFGVLVSSTDGSANPVSISPLLNYRYTGKFFDDSTDLQNNINRWYENTTGKWLSVDPIGFNGGDANLYRYVRNRLINKFDYNGKSIFDTGVREPINDTEWNYSIIDNRKIFNEAVFVWANNYWKKEEIDRLNSLFRDIQYRMSLMIRYANMIPNYLASSKISCDCQNEILKKLKPFTSVLNGIQDFLSGNKKYTMYQSDIKWPYNEDDEPSYATIVKWREFIILNNTGDLDWHKRSDEEVRQTLFHELSHIFGTIDNYSKEYNKVSPDSYSDLLNAHQITYFMQDNLIKSWEFFNTYTDDRMSRYAVEILKKTLGSLKKECKDQLSKYLDSYSIELELIACHSCQ